MELKKEKICLTLYSYRSTILRRFETGNCPVVTGLSGVELAQRVISGIIILNLKGRGEKMRFTKTVTRKLAMLICLALVLTMLPVSEAKADTGVIAVTTSGGDIRLSAGGSTQLQVGSTVQYYGQTYTVSRYTFNSDNRAVASVDASGRVTALKTGTAQITVQIYTTQDWYDYDDNDDYNDYDDDYRYEPSGEYLLFQAEYEVRVCPDLSGITVDKTSQTGYTADSWNCPTYTFHLKSKEVLTEDWDTVVLSCSSSNSRVGVDADLDKNVLTITPYSVGKTTVTVSINDQQICKLTINTILVQMSTNSALLAIKETKQLRVKGAPAAAIKWSSTNPKVVTVSSKGLVRAKSSGNAVIKAKIGDNMFGCAVSVVTQSRKKAINTAIHIVRTSTYSQPKRMQNKYYDCSSLVWKAYHKNGVNFGNAYYAPVAADIGKWCAQKKRMVKGGLSVKNIDSMKINAGDIMFRTGDNNGRYKGIYHVEMIVGYTCYGFDSNGKPMLSLKYAARADGYADGCGEPVGRP